jgi:hypothetical protein
MDPPERGRSIFALPWQREPKRVDDADPIVYPDCGHPLSDTDDRRALTSCAGRFGSSAESKAAAAD